MPVLTTSVTVSTGAYQAGDTIGTLMSIINNSLGGDFDYILQNIHISSPENIKPTGNILLFHQDPTGVASWAATDNAAFSYGTSAAALAYEIASIPVVADDWVTVNSVAKADIDGRGRAMKKGEGALQYLAGVFVTDGAPDWAAAVALTFKWGFLKGRINA